MTTTRIRHDKNDEWVMGIDEAGRGPVLGAMLYGACICPKSKLADLKKTGVFDSKQLTDEKRRMLFKMMKNSDYLEYLVDSIPANWMSDAMIQQNRYSLNEISHDSAIGLIQITLNCGYNLKHVYLDTVGTPQLYEKKLINHFTGYDIRFTVAKKADALYPVVSAASIAAKVTRDNILNNWKFDENHLKYLNNNNNNNDNDNNIDIDMDNDDNDDIDIDLNIDININNNEDCWLGSGYPGHDKTKKFMQDYVDKVFGYPNIVRFSWSTAKIIIAERCAQVTFSDETADNNLSKWFLKPGNKVKRSHFYKQRNMTLCFENPF